MSTTSNFAYQAKLYNETFALKSSLWKLQKWLNQFRGKSASPSPCSTISRSSNTINRNKRKQENENNFRSIIEELQTMLGSHKRKHKIARVHKKPTQYYTLNRELKNIGENLNLSVEDEVDDSKQMTKIFYGSKHQLSQFTFEIGFNNITCDIIPNECEISITLCEKDPDDDDNYVDLIFNKFDTKTIINDLQLMIDEGDFDTLNSKILFIKHLDDFHNYFPTLLLKNLILNSDENNNGKGSIHKDIELCLKILPNIIEYKRLLDGPCVIYAQQIMDCILTKIKPPKVWKLSFVGLYPSNCIGLSDSNSVINKSMNIKPIVKVNECKENSDDGEYLLYWFTLSPAVIVPIEIAKKLFVKCMADLATKYDKNSDVKLDGSEDKRSAHSSKNIDETYCYYNMLTGSDMKYMKMGVEIFENEWQYYKCKNTDYCGNGVKIDQLYIYDLNYISENNIKESILFDVINELKNWVLMNQLYSQCFEHNYKKWKIVCDKMNLGNMQKINNKFEISIKNSNHLEVRHVVYDGNDEESNEENKDNEMDIDGNGNDNGYEKYRNDYKLPPNVNEWLADFFIDEKHNISVKVKYWILDEEMKEKNLKMEIDNVCDEENALEIDVMYEKKVSAILQKTNSVSITLSYISQLFDGRYLKEKLKREQMKKQHDVEVNENDNDDNMIDID